MMSEWFKPPADMLRLYSKALQEFAWEQSGPEDAGAERPVLPNPEIEYARNTSAIRVLQAVDENLTIGVVLEKRGAEWKMGDVILLPGEGGVHPGDREKLHRFVQWFCASQNPFVKFLDRCMGPNMQDVILKGHVRWGDEYGSVVSRSFLSVAFLSIQKFYQPHGGTDHIHEIDRRLQDVMRVCRANMGFQGLSEDKLAEASKECLVSVLHELVTTPELVEKGKMK